MSTKEYLIVLAVFTLILGVASMFAWFDEKANDDNHR